MLHPRSSSASSHQQVLLPHGWGNHTCSRGCPSTSGALYTFPRPERGTQGKVPLPSLAASPPWRRWQPLLAQVGGYTTLHSNNMGKNCINPACLGSAWRMERMASWTWTDPTGCQVDTCRSGRSTLGSGKDTSQSAHSRDKTISFWEGRTTQMKKCSPTEDRQKESDWEGLVSEWEIFWAKTGWTGALPSEMMERERAWKRQEQRGCGGLSPGT